MNWELFLVLAVNMVALGCAYGGLKADTRNLKDGLAEAKADMRNLKDGLAEAKVTLAALTARVNVFFNNRRKP